MAKELILVHIHFPFTLFFTFQARFHFLVLPKENISSLKKLEKDHLPLLRHMQQKGRELAEK